MQVGLCCAHDAVPESFPLLLAIFGPADVRGVVARRAALHSLGPT